MGLINETLTGSTIYRAPLDAPTGKIVVTQAGGTAAEVFATADGTDPVLPSSGLEIPGGQRALAAAAGAQIVLQPPFPGGHMAIPQIRLLSVGTPTVSIEW